jgi:hypothetical protein
MAAVGTLVSSQSAPVAVVAGAVEPVTTARVVVPSELRATLAVAEAAFCSEVTLSKLIVVK